MTLTDKEIIEIYNRSAWIRVLMVQEHLAQKSAKDQGARNDRHY